MQADVHSSRKRGDNFPEKIISRQSEFSGQFWSYCSFKGLSKINSDSKLSKKGSRRPIFTIEISD